MVVSSMTQLSQEAASESEPGAVKLRICMPTARDFARRTYQCSLYEAQDVLLEGHEIDLIRLEPRWGFRFQYDWQKRLAYHDISKTLASWNPGLRKVSLAEYYDVFVAVCQGPSDLLYMNAIKGWQDRCQTSICWLDELWAVDVPLLKQWMPALRRFEHVFVGCRGTVAPLSEALGKKCHWMPGGTDTFRFSPYPNPPARVIDVYSIGRRLEGIHRALYGAALRKEIFYSYDTCPEIADLQPYDHRQHREFLANMVKRSRYFLVAPGKVTRASETRGQIEVSYRYFEGASAGAVMLGQVPECDAYGELFPWPDAVVPIKTDGSDTMDVIGSLNSDRDRLSAMSRRNAAESFLRHDWIWRWKEIFRGAGLRPTAAMRARERRLRELASIALQTT
jgi:Glycosyl transferases group 1